MFFRSTPWILALPSQDSTFLIFWATFHENCLSHDFRPTAWKGWNLFFAASIDQLVQVHWWWTSWSNAPRTIIIVVVLVVVVVPQQNWLFNSWRPMVWGSIAAVHLNSAPWKLSNLDELQLNHVESIVTFLLGFWFLFPFSETWNDSSEIHWLQKPRHDVRDLPADCWLAFWEIKFARKLIGIQIIQPRLPNGCQIWTCVWTNPPCGMREWNNALMIKSCKSFIPKHPAFSGLSVQDNGLSFEGVSGNTLCQEKQLAAGVLDHTQTVAVDSYFLSLLFWEVNYIEVWQETVYHSSCWVGVNHFEWYPHMES